MQKKLERTHKEMNEVESVYDGEEPLYQIQYHKTRGLTRP